MMTITIATLLALTLPQRKSLAAALIGYAHGSQAFKVDHGFTPQVAQRIAEFIQDPSAYRGVHTNHAFVGQALTVIVLLPTMPYTVSDQARERGTYLRALCKLGLIDAPTSEARDKACRGVRQATTDAAVAAIFIRFDVKIGDYVRCENGRKCRHHATGAGQHWSCGPDAYEPSHGSDDQKVVGEQEADLSSKLRKLSPRTDGLSHFATNRTWREALAQCSPNQGVIHDCGPKPDSQEHDGDVECVSCFRRFWSGEGHPTIPLCPGCWNPPGGNPIPAPTVTTPQDRSVEPDLDFTFAPLPEGYKPPPSSGERFPGFTPGLDEGAIDAITFPADLGPWEG